MLSGYIYRKLITIDYTKTDVTETDVPVVIKLTTGNLDFSHARSDGFDLRFTDLNDNVLSYLRIVHDQANSVAVYLVKIPSISHTADTQIYLYYGDSDASDGVDDANVFDSNHKGVWPLHEASGTFYDLTQNNQDGASGGTLSRGVAAKIYKGVTFGSVTKSYVNIGAMANMTSWSFSCWCKPTTVDTNAYTLASNDRVGYNDDVLIGVDPESGSGTTDKRLGCVHQDDNNSKRTISQDTSDVVANDWYFVTIESDGTNLIVMVNESQKASVAKVGADLHWDGATTYIGDTTNTAVTRFWKGIIELALISNVNRGLSRHKIDYNAGNGTLLVVGDEVCLLDTSDTFTLSDAWEIDTSPIQEDISDSLILSDSWELTTIPEFLDISDSLTLDDSWELTTIPEFLDISDSLTLDDSWELQLNPESQNISDSLTLDDSWELQLNPESQNISDSLTLDDNWSFVKILLTPLNTDFRWIENIQKSIQTHFSWLLAKNISTDFRWIANTTKSITTDFRWLSAPYTTLLPIDYSNIQIFVNGLDLFLNDDIDIKTGSITHTIGQKSTATFTLARRHDDLDRTHTGSASEITNQNSVQIYIKGNLEFDGFISNLSVDSEKETVLVTALMDQPQDNRNYVTIPLSSVNEKIHLYHCITNRIQIDDPKEDEDEPKPQYYKGVKVDLGIKIQQQTDSWRSLELIIDGKGVNATKIEDGTFITKPNYSYFWAVLVKNIRTGISNGDYRYIGTSLASTTTDLWAIMGASPTYQKIKDNIETELGYYYVGSAPYKEISCKNGQLIISAKYQDRSDGLYNVYEESYNYIDFAKKIADLEYQKLFNIHGDILPIVTAGIEITFDAYYYYAIKLLTRINIDNTTVANTYNNSNGFPVSVKSINISFATMKVSLSTDNRLSQEELDEIDAQMPDEESSIYVVPERAVRVYRKFDLKSWMFVS